MNKLCEQLDNEASTQELMDTINQFSTQEWSQFTEMNDESPMILALRHERYDVIASLIDQGHQYLNIFGKNFKMLTGILKELPESEGKLQIFEALQRRNEADFLDHLE